VWVCGGGGLGGVGCCRVGSLLTFDIPQTALVATLDTYDFMITRFVAFLSMTIITRVTRHSLGTTRCKISAFSKW
jgi:hypothetical protein